MIGASCSSGVLTISSSKIRAPVGAGMDYDGEAHSTLQMSEWVPHGFEYQLRVRAREKAYLYLPREDHLERIGATLHEVTVGPHAGKLLLFGGKNRGEFESNAYLIDPNTHQVLGAPIAIPDYGRMADAIAHEITQGTHAGKVILMSANTFLNSPKSVIIDLSLESLSVVGEFPLRSGVSIKSHQIVTPSARHDFGSSLLASVVQDSSTEIFRYSLDQPDLRTGSWQSAGSLQVRRIQPRFAQLKDPSGADGALLVLPSDATPTGQSSADSDPSRVFARVSNNGVSSWDAVVVHGDLDRLHCGGRGALWIFPNVGVAAGKVIRYSGVPLETNRAPDTCKYSMDVFQISLSTSSSHWSLTRDGSFSDLVDPSNGSSTPGKAAVIQAGPFRGDLVIAQTSSESLVRIRLSRDVQGALVKTTSLISVEQIIVANNTDPPDSLRRRNPSLVALSDGRVLIAGGECGATDTAPVSCSKRVAVLSPYTPLKFTISGSADARVEVLGSLSSFFDLQALSRNEDNQSARWLLFPKPTLYEQGERTLSMRARDQSLLQSNTLNYSIDALSP